MTTKKQMMQEKMAKLQSTKQMLLSDVNSRAIINQWLEYKSMTPRQKDLLMQDWDKYFKEVRETKAYLRYKKISELQKQHKPFSEYCEKASEQLENEGWELPKPYLNDPLFLQNNQCVTKYEQTMLDIENLKTESQMDDIASTLI